MTDEHDFDPPPEVASRLRKIRDQLESLRKRIIAQREQTSRELETFRHQREQSEQSQAACADVVADDQTLPVVPSKARGPTNPEHHWRSPEVWRVVGAQRALHVALEQCQSLRQSIQRERLERQLKELQMVRRQIVDDAKSLAESHPADRDTVKAFANHVAEYSRMLDDTQKELLSELRRAGVKVRSATRHRSGIEPDEVL